MKIDINKLKEGSTDEFEKFYNIYVNRIYTIIYRVVGNEADAEDLTLEVMMKIYNKIRTFKGEAKLLSWVYRIAYNHGISHLRSQKKTESLDSLNYTIKSNREGQLKHLEEKEKRAFVRRKLMELPEKYRVAISLYHFNDLSYNEIADVMGEKIGTVKTYIHRGRKKLKILVGELE
ncbi:MAG: RNA polymerase sigma factor [candidate division WOR-3 bacterium]|nr:RNA polymerase sigma factor [candidate division WOR-3 bacterium]